MNRHAATAPIAPEAPTHAATEGGLQLDLQQWTRPLQARRRWLGWLAAGAVSPLGLVACGGGGDDAAAGSSDTSSSSGSGSSSDSSSTSDGTCSVIPEETAGPYPGDGSNTSNGSVANALALSGIVRSDLTHSIGGATGVAEGVPLSVTLTLVNTGGACAALVGYAVYLWHCDQAGRYSMYSSGVVGENYLRGVQETDAQARVSFTTIVPGCYDGRVPHMHFEIYPSLALATSASHKLRTSQLTFPRSMLQTVYAQSGYEASVSNLAAVSTSTDNVFSDGTSLQMCSVSGAVGTGYTATLQVGIAA